MKPNVKSKLNDRLNNGYSLSVSEIFSKTFETFKGIWVIAGLAYLLVFIIQNIVGQLFDFALGVSKSLSVDLDVIQEMETFGEVMEVYRQIFEQHMNHPLYWLLLFFQTLIGILAIPAYCGVFKLAYEYDYNKQVNFSDFFHYFKSPYLGRILIAAILLYIVIAIASAFFIIPGIYLGVAYSIVFPFIVFADAKPWEAMEASRKVLTKNWFKVFGILIVTVIVTIIGAFSGLLICCVGFIATYPLAMVFFYLVFYSLYKEIIGFDEHSEIDQIGESFNTNYTS